MNACDKWTWFILMDRPFGKWHICNCYNMRKCFLCLGVRFFFFCFKSFDFVHLVETKVHSVAYATFTKALIHSEMVKVGKYESGFIFCARCLFGCGLGEKRNVSKNVSSSDTKWWKQVVIMVQRNISQAHLPFRNCSNFQHLFQFLLFRFMSFSFYALCPPLSCFREGRRYKCLPYMWLILMMTTTNLVEKYK